MQFALFIKFSVQRLAAGKELYSFAGAQKTGGAAAGSLDMGVIETSYPVQRGSAIRLPFAQLFVTLLAGFLGRLMCFSSHWYWTA